MSSAAEPSRHNDNRTDVAPPNLGLQNEIGGGATSSGRGGQSHKVLINEGKVVEKWEQAWKRLKPGPQSPIGPMDVVVWGGEKAHDSKESDSSPGRWTKALIFDDDNREMTSLKPAVQGSWYSKLMATLAIENSKPEEGAISSTRDGPGNCDSIFSTVAEVTKVLESSAGSISGMDAETAQLRYGGVARIVRMTIKP